MLQVLVSMNSPQFDDCRQQIPGVIVPQHDALFLGKQLQEKEKEEGLAS
jgi:hypothetical protein